MTRTNSQLRILLMEEQMKEDREKSLAIHHAKFGGKEYSWEADYGDGTKEHTAPIESTDAEWSIFDNTLRPLPINLYLDCKEYERGERWHKLGPEYVLSPNYLHMAALLYHVIFYALPLWLFIMLYW